MSLEQALWDAAKKGEETTVEWSVGRGADVNWRNSANARKTPLHKASENGHAAVVAQLLEANATLEAKDIAYFTPLHLGAYNSHVAVVTQLLKAKADVNAENNFHFTALMFASRQGHASLVEILLEAGADVNLKGGQPDWLWEYNSVQLARHEKHTEVVALLKRAKKTTAGTRRAQWESVSGSLR